MNKPRRDIAFEHGVRFHLVPGGKLGPREIMLTWERDTAEGHAGALVNMDEGNWPDAIPPVSAVFIATRAVLDEAIALVGKHVGPGAH